MPQQFVNYDYMRAVQPIQQGVSNLAAIGTTFTEESAAKRKQDKINNEAYQQIYGLFGKVPDTGIDWEASKPKPDEGAAYTERLAKLTPGIFDVLENKGVDPHEFVKALSTPGASYADIKDRLDKQLFGKVQRELLGGAAADSVAAIKAGQQPLSTAQATAIPRANIPKTYAEVTERVRTSGLSPERQTAMQLIIAGVGRREASEVAKGSEGSASKFYTGLIEKGIPIDETTKALGEALLKEDAMAYKQRYLAMRGMEQKNSALRTLLQDKQFRQNLQLKYGDKSAKVVKEMDSVQKEISDINYQIENIDKVRASAMMKGNPPPDQSILMRRLTEVQGRYSKLQSALPDIDRQINKLYGSNVVNWPEMGEGGTSGGWGVEGPPPAPEAKPTLDEQAREMYKRAGILNPSAVQMQAAIEKLQKRQ